MQVILSKRQREVMRLLEKGKTLKEISAALGISVNTVKGHGKALRRKCGDAPCARAAIYQFYHPYARL